MHAGNLTALDLADSDLHNSTRVAEAASLVSSSRPDSSEPVTNSRDGGIEVGDCEVSEAESLTFTKIETLFYVCDLRFAGHLMLWLVGLTDKHWLFESSCCLSLRGKMTRKLSEQLLSQGWYLLGSNHTVSDLRRHYSHTVIRLSRVLHESYQFTASQ
jgi:hypothetical protein